MWINQKLHYRSFFIVVRIGFENGFTLPLPVPLFLLDQALDAVEDLVWLAEKLFLQWAVQSPNGNNDQRTQRRYWNSFAGTPTKAVQLCREITWELRRYGKWRMAEVEVRDPKHPCRVRVYVDFI